MSGYGSLTFLAGTSSIAYIATYWSDRNLLDRGAARRASPRRAGRSGGTAPPAPGVVNFILSQLVTGLGRGSCESEPRASS